MMLQKINKTLILASLLVFSITSISFADTIVYSQDFVGIAEGDPIPDWTTSGSFESYNSLDYSGLVGPYGKVITINSIVTYDNGSTWTDFTFEFISRARNGAEMYECFRHSASGGYAIKHQAYSQNLTLIKYSGDDPYLNQTLLGTFNNASHDTLLITANGTTIKLSEGGIERISVTDSTYIMGTIALKSKGSSNQDIDNIVVTSTTAPSGKKTFGIGSNNFIKIKSNKKQSSDFY